MHILMLALKSLKNRKVATSLTLISIALSVGLILGLEKVRKGTRQSFHQTISQTDLIVGARGGPLRLLLYTVFNIGYPTNNIQYETYTQFKNHPLVKWTVPFSLGDSHKGYRVVGTTEDFYRHYRFHGKKNIVFHRGRFPKGVYGAVVGHDVAKQLGYQLGQSIVIAHGLTEGLEKHDEHPFKVVGILEATLTPVDRTVYIPLEGMEAIHVGWGGEQPTKSQIGISQITSFLVRTKKRIHTLSLQRVLNTYEPEPLMAIIPGFTLHRLWQGLRYAEDSLRVIAFCVLLVSFLAMIIALYTTLSERRREMAILRALGASPRTVLFLFVFEAMLLTTGGMILGVLLTYGGLWIGQPILESKFGVFLPLTGLSMYEVKIFVLLFFMGVIAGLIPAWRAYRRTLSDGLSITT